MSTPPLLHAATARLPVGAVLDELAARLANGDAVLEAPPGAGKTTLVGAKRL